MRVVLLLEPLLARRVQVPAANGDHVVTAIGRWIPYRLVFAHERDGDLRGDAAEGARVGADVYNVPGATVRQACLCGFLLVICGVVFFSLCV